MIMPTGPAPPDATGELGRGCRAPVAWLIEKAEIELSTLLAINRKLPVASSVAAKGCCPVGSGMPMGVRVPLLLNPKADTELPPTLLR